MPYQFKALTVSLLPTHSYLHAFECDGGSENPPGPPPSPPGPDAARYRYTVRGYAATAPEAEDVDEETTELRLLLQTALARLGGPVNTDDLRPKSLEELDMLEGKLEEALAEVRELRAKFS